MKTLLFLIIALGSIAQADDVYVNGYTQLDGTYVSPYMRTAPDNTVTNNYDYVQPQAQPQPDYEHYNSMGSLINRNSGHVRRK